MVTPVWRSPLGPRLAWAAVLAVAAAAFGARVGNGFVWDDHTMIEFNPAVTGEDGWWRALTGELAYHAKGSWQMAYYRPALVAAWRLLWAAGGGAPWAFHAASVALHLLNATLAFALLPRLGVPRGVAFAAAALLAVHPLSGEAVYWAVALQEEILLGCLLGALLALRAAREASPGRRLALQLVAAAASAVAAFTKETGGLVAVLAAVDALTADGERWARLRATWPVWPGPAAYAAIRAALVTQERMLGFDRLGERVLRAAEIVLWDFRRLLWPFPQSPIHELPPAGALELVAAGAAAAIALWVVVRRLPRGPFWAAWIVLPLLPPVGHALLAADTGMPVAERYLFVSVLPVLVVLAQGARALALRLAPRRAPALLAAAGIAIGVASAVAAWRYGAAWRDDETTFSRVVAVYPAQPHALQWLGFQAMERGDAEAAVRLLEASRRSYWGFPTTHFQLGSAYARLGRIDEALAAYALAGTINPRFAAAWVLRADLLRDAGRLAEARADYQRAVAADGALVRARFSLGNVLYLEGDVAGAAAHWEVAAAAAAGACELLYNLTMAYRRLGRPADARRRGEEFLQGCGAGYEAELAQVRTWLSER